MGKYFVATGDKHITVAGQIYIAQLLDNYINDHIDTKNGFNTAVTINHRAPE
ncbi:hypothetical protein D3C84_1209570 [compost metagenome]